VRWISRLASAQNTHPSNGAATPALNFFSPVRLIVACAITLAMIVVVGAGLIAYNLRTRAMSENALALSNSALIVAKQIEQTFSAVQAVERRFHDDLSGLPVIDSETIEREYKRHAVHLKLRDKAGGMPYVGSLAIFNAKGQLINFSRHWPIPDVNVANEDYFRALRASRAITSFLGEPVRDHATGSWVIQLAHKISGPSGEFLGVISAAIELHYLQNYFRDISPNPNSSFALFRSDGTLLVRYPETDSDIGRKFPTALALKLVVNADHGVGSIDGVIDGIPRMIASHRVEGYPVVVSATRATSSILARWQRTTPYVAGTAALILAVIAAFALLFTRLFRNYQALEQAHADRNRAEQLQSQSLRFNVALNNMSHGLAMFDSTSRLVVVNARFLEMYGLSPDVVKPGLSLLDLLKHRKERGSFGGDPEEYHAKILAQSAKRTLTKQNVPTPAGRIIKIVNQPMPDGGWVATHEDITDKIEAETAIKKQKAQLGAALAHISQGVCMFDASKRLIICNKQYADI
jgi:PAS domain-containing protein